MNATETRTPLQLGGSGSRNGATLGMPKAAASIGDQAGKTGLNASGIEWLTKTGIAKHLKCSVRHINNLMRRRVLPFVKLGRFVRFDVAACDLAMKKIQTKSLFG